LTRMDRGTPEQEQPITSERQQQIAEITERDRLVFTEWLQTNPDQPRLDMPSKVARRFIPTRLLELAEQPPNIAVGVFPSSKNTLGIYIVEAMPTPLSDYASFESYREEAMQADAARISRPKTPNNVDPKHALYAPTLHDAGLKMNDKILLHILLRQVVDDELFVENYDDRPGYRGKGVATSFNYRLREVAGQMNEQYITGDNREENIGFFTKGLGRVRFSDLQGELRTKLWRRHFLDETNLIHRHNAEFLTVDILDPEEKSRSVSPDAS
jgi:hypothetical protein